jgi:Protein of unknown function (DUF2608)
MAEIRNISSFEDVVIIQNSLIVIDIDDTLIKYSQFNQTWWINKIQHYHTLTKKYELAEHLANEEWNKHIETCEPEIVDKYIHDFIDMAKSKDCHIVLLTARNDIIRELTKKHLLEVNLYFEHIYFNKDKGAELVKIVETDYAGIYKNIIVIDDMEKNLLNIRNKMNLSKYELHLYKITREIVK